MTQPADTRFCESVESGHSDQEQTAKIAARLDIRGDPVRVDGQTKYAIVARGEVSIYLRLPRRKDYREKIWDHAAGMIVVEEAGGRVTDVEGKPSTSPTVASSKTTAASSPPTARSTTRCSGPSGSSRSADFLAFSRLFGSAPARAARPAPQPDLGEASRIRHTCLSLNADREKEILWQNAPRW